MKRLLVLSLLATYLAILAFICAPLARARPPIPASVFKAVRAYWHTKTGRIKAFDIVYCESRYSVWARNGQYENIFQMGVNERRHFGWHVAGSSPLLAARAAYRYYREAGWSPWSCARIVGIR